MNLQNENQADRAVRLIVAIAGVILGYYTHGGMRDIWLVVAAIAAISGLSGFSLFYKLIGFRTLKR